MYYVLNSFTDWISELYGQRKYCSITCAWCIDMYECLILWHVSVCRFRTCLKMAGTGPANLIGKLFFNIVQTKCFVLKPQKLCVKRSWWGKCLKYEYRKQAHLRDNIPYWGTTVECPAYLLIEFHWRQWSSALSDAARSGPTSCWKEVIVIKSLSSWWKAVVTYIHRVWTMELLN
jgi:hypothetical protein